jgi:Na+/H+-dicarboxylate symporter
MFKRIPLHTQIVIGLLLGVAWALVSSYLGYSSFTINYVLPFGTIFINLLKLIAVPLVLFSIITGISGLSDITQLGRMGLKTVSMYIATTVLAIMVGLLLVNAFKPGAYGDQEQRIVNRISYELWVEGNGNVQYADEKRFLQNPEYAGYLTTASQKIAAYESADIVKEGKEKAGSKKEEGPLQWLVDMVPSNIFFAFSESLMLQVIFFALFFGVTIVMLPRSRMEYIIGFCTGANDIFIKMVDIVMKAAPFFVFALLAGKLAEMAGDDVNRLLSVFYALGRYALLVVIGLVIMIFVVYPVIISSVLAKKYNLSFIKAGSFFLKSIRPAQLLAFSTSSSAATLPVTMECVHENIGVDEEVSSFVLPIGATVNMDGTSLYQGIAVIFLAQFHMVELSLAQQLTIVVTATLASIGSAAVPSSGLIMLIIVLESVGLNPAWIAIIFPVDRPLDMIRTIVNVTGDAAVSTIVASSENRLELKT